MHIRTHLTNQAAHRLDIRSDAYEPERRVWMEHLARRTETRALRLNPVV